MINPIQTTTANLAVYGCKAYHNPKTTLRDGYSGRVRVTEGDAYPDEYVKWDNQGKAINHRFGDLEI